MNIKQTMRNLVLGGLLLIPVALAALLPVGAVRAEESCGGVKTAIISCAQPGRADGASNVAVENTGVWGLLILTINIMTAGVGVLAVAGIVYGGVLYTTSGGNPEQVKKARTVFANVVIGVVSFGVMFTLLNFIVPGGVFN